MIYTIDAKNRTLGRVASEAAMVLRGKKDASFTPNKVSDVKLKVINVGQIKITGNKTQDKKYKSYSGYPGGLKEVSFERFLEKKGMIGIFKKAVMGMIPRNRLRDKIMKNLTLEN
jgi:large subunit ribosomal protein L13